MLMQKPMPMRKPMLTRKPRSMTFVRVLLFVVALFYLSLVGSTLPAYADENTQKRFARSKQVRSSSVKPRIGESHLGKKPPEFTENKTQWVNTQAPLTLDSLKGKWVLLLFTSTG